MRTTITAWPVWCLALLLLCGLALTLPTETISQGPRPLLRLESSVFLTDGMTLEQTVELTQPVPAQAAFRVWILLEQSNAPFLTMQCRGDQVAGPLFRVVLPSPDGAYHLVEQPWCDLPGQQRVVLRLHGHGVRVMTTAADRIAGALLQDGVPVRSSDLVLQLRQRKPGIDRYLPVSRWAAGKPGLPGWKPLYLLLPCLYLACAAVLLRLVFSRRVWQR